MQNTTSSKEGYRKSSPNSLPSKHNWKKVIAHKQESKNPATAQKNCWEHDSIQCVKDNICESKWDYKELQQKFWRKWKASIQDKNEMKYWAKESKENESKMVRKIK